MFCFNILFYDVVIREMYWSEDRNYKNRTLTLALLRNWVSSASFQITARVINPTAGDFLLTQIIENWIEKF